MLDRTMWLLLISNAVASIGTGVVMIAIPWALASQSSGDALFGVIATTVNFALFIATPLIGPLIDGSSRRKLMSHLRSTYIASAALLLAIDHFTESRHLLLVGCYVLGSTFYAINIPLRTAYVQELFEGRKFLKINSILEIENQIAAAITGVVGIFVIKNIDVTWIITGNIALYIFAMVCLSAIPAPPRHFSAKRLPYWLSLGEGWRIISRRPAVAAMMIASSLPYVIVILFTVLHPIALSNLPDASGSTYALVELLFALGAIAGGFVFSWVGGRMLNARRALLASLLGFALVVVLQASFPTLWGYITLGFGLGLGNALARILRQSLMMEEFATHETGRVGALLQSIIMAERAVLMTVLTSIIAGSGVASALWFMATVSIVGPLVFFTAMKSVPSSQSNLLPSQET